MAIRLPNLEDVQAVLDEAHRLDTEKLKQALDAPRLSTGLDHWQFWLLICLSRHVARQKWVGYIVETKLRGELDEIGNAGAFGHPEGLAQRGKVPDFPEWTYYFHGRGCCLTHADGAEIDVDFTDDGESTQIDPYFYSNFLQSLRKPEFPEYVMKKTPCLRNYWQQDLDKLQILGCWNARQVTEFGLQIHEVLTPIIEHLSNPARSSDKSAIHQTLYLLLHLGDHVQASDVAKVSDLAHSIVDELNRRAATAKAARQDLLIDAMSQPSARYGIPLQALAELGPELAKDAVVESLFRTPVDGAANVALEIWSLWQLDDFDPVLEEVVAFRTRAGERSFLERVFRKSTEPVKTSDDMPRDHQLVHLARLLCLRHGHSLKGRMKSLLTKGLQGIETASGGEAAFLLCFLDMKLGLDALRKALADRVPITNYDAAAACVLINSEETKRLLLAALRLEQLEKQHTAACALGRLPEGHDIPELKNWMRAQDGIADPLGRETKFGEKTVQTYSMSDVSHANMQSAIDSAVRRLGDLAQLFPGSTNHGL
jgi:hypothetical protein